MSDGSTLSLLSISGKVQLKALSRRKQHEQKRHERRLLARQLRNNKRQEALQRHRERGTASTPPLLVALVSLHQAAPPQQALTLLTAADPDLTVTRSEQGVTHVRSVGDRIGQQYGHSITSHLHESSHNLSGHIVFSFAGFQQLICSSSVSCVP